MNPQDFRVVFVGHNRFLTCKVMYRDLPVAAVGGRVGSLENLYKHLEVSAHACIQNILAGKNPAVVKYIEEKTAHI